jgi:hypothetical protein
MELIPGKDMALVSSPKYSEAYVINTTNLMYTSLLLSLTL